MTLSYKPRNLPDMIPYLVVQNPKKSLEFYQNAFGFEVIDKVLDDAGNLQHVEMQRGPIVIMFCPEGAMGTTAKSPASRGTEEAISLYCYCENVDKVYEQAMKNGATSPMSPEDHFWGDRMCVLLDLDNYKWCFATHLNGK
ncbi:MAG: VOC family protein [Pseudomonadota bacterium]